MFHGGPRAGHERGLGTVPASRIHINVERLERQRSMQGTLILAVLNVKSSYLQEIEQPLDDATDVPDTLQWWIGADCAWRIKTFAIDHDIHTHSIEKGGQEVVELAQANNRKHYGDVIEVQHVVEFQNCTNAKEVQQAFRRIGLAPRLEVAEGRFAFWKPDEEQYRTKSQPK